MSHQIKKPSKNFSDKANAKINLFLHVTGKLDNGYHLLESLVVFDNAYDYITVHESNNISLETYGKFSENIPSGNRNLVLIAAEFLADKYNVKQGASIKLEKNLPVAAGIGGGSSDAATTIKLLSRLWSLSIDNDELVKISVALGADVPICTFQDTAIISGIGEVIKPIENLPEIPLLLVNPMINISSSDIYRMGGFNFRESLLNNELEITNNLKDITYYLKDKTSNDLYDNALTIAPEIADVIDEISLYEGCLLSRMSGSGSTCFGIFENIEQVTSVAKNIKMRFPEWWTNVNN